MDNVRQVPWQWFELRGERGSHRQLARRPTQQRPGDAYLDGGQHWSSGVIQQGLWSAQK